MTRQKARKSGSVGWVSAMRGGPDTVLGVWVPRAEKASDMARWFSLEPVNHSSGDTSSPRLIRPTPFGLKVSGNTGQTFSMLLANYSQALRRHQIGCHVDAVRRSPLAMALCSSHPGGRVSSGASAFRVLSVSWSREGCPGLLLLVPRSVCRDLGVHRLSMVVVVGQRRINDGQGQVGEFGDDVFRAHPLPLVHDGQVLDLDAAAGDAGLAAQGSGVLTMCSRMTGYSAGFRPRFRGWRGRFHDLIVPQSRPTGQHTSLFRSRSPGWL